MNTHQRGDISIYIALLLVSIFLTSALIFNGILVRQLQVARTMLDSERAFFAADAGLEEGLYQLSEKFQPLYRKQGQVDYQQGAGTESALYDIEVCKDNDNQSHGRVVGTVRNQRRAISVGDGRDCVP
jgi:hypothetical protein